MLTDSMGLFRASLTGLLTSQPIAVVALSTASACRPRAPSAGAQIICPPAPHPLAPQQLEEILHKQIVHINKYWLCSRSDPTDPPTRTEPIFVYVNNLFRGCSQIMSAKNGWVQTPPPPFVSCQHLPNPPYLFHVSFVNIFKTTSS